MSTQLTFAFNGKNEAAQSAAAKHAAWLVAGVSEDTRKALRALVAKSIREGVPPLEAARSIRMLVGLNAPQALAASKYEAELRLNGLSPERVEKALEFYTARKVKERADTISRTETLSALNAGSLEGWKQAQKKGFLSRGARKTFLTTPDEKLCPICRPMNKQEQPLGKPFVKPDGSKIMFPPAHPRCRCTMSEPTAPEPSKRKTIESVLFPGSEWLRSSPIIERLLLSAGGSGQPTATEVYDLTLQTASGLQHAIFKPADVGSITKALISDGILSKDASTSDRELLSAAFGRVLGVGVPPILGRVVQLGSGLSTGSIQEAVSESVQFRSLLPFIGSARIKWPTVSESARNGISLLDMLIGNPDRHAGNLLVKIPGLLPATLKPAYTTALQSVLNVFPIDHGYSFGTALNSGFASMGFGRWMNPSIFRHWWHSAPDWKQNIPGGSILAMSPDEHVRWETKLSEARTDLVDLIDAAPLSSIEKLMASRRIRFTLDALRLNSLGTFFNQMLGII